MRGPPRVPDSRVSSGYQAWLNQAHPGVWIIARWTSGSTQVPLSFVPGRIDIDLARVCPENAALRPVEEKHAMAQPNSIRPDTSDMAAVHQVFRSSLASAPVLIESAAGDEDRRTLIASYYTNVLAFLEAHHDGEEELLFPLLIERAPQQKSDVDLAIEQHQDVLTLLAAARTSVTAWEPKGDAEAPELMRTLGSLNVALSAHLDQEEARLVPLATEYVTVEEWGMLPGHAMANFDGDKIWLIMGLIRENFTPEQRAMMLEHMPPPPRQMWETMGEASFNEMIADVRQTN